MRRNNQYTNSELLNTPLQYQYSSVISSLTHHEQNLDKGYVKWLAKIKIPQSHKKQIIFIHRNIGIDDNLLSAASKVSELKIYILKATGQKVSIKKDYKLPITFN